VVPSPEPRSIVEIETIRLLVDHDVLVTCVGGGGIPVVPDGAGGLKGVEAVIDKDLSAALLAKDLQADALLLLTDVPNVIADWGTSAARPLHDVTPEVLRGFEFAPGSMRPKVDAVCRFVEAGGEMAAIGALSDAAATLAGAAGTVVRVSRQPCT
jgi:carbamate kinase